MQAITLNPAMNPEAPEIVIVGKGPQVQKRAHLLFNSQVSVPTFLKRKSAQWEYVGKYKADQLKIDKKTIEKYKKHGKAETLYGILFLKKS